MIDDILKRHRIISDQVSEKEIRVILRELLVVLDRNVLGDVVEFGCYKGTTSLFLARVLGVFNTSGAASTSRAGSFVTTKAAATEPRNDAREGAVRESSGAKASKKLWLYDSFAGLPEKTVFDNSHVGDDFKAGELATTKIELVKNFRRENLPMPIIKKSWFRDLIDRDIPLQICFAFFDGDFYESIRDSFRATEQCFVPGATIVVDDYQNEALPGAAKATDEWIKQNSMRVKNFRAEQSLGIIHLH